MSAPEQPAPDDESLDELESDEFPSYFQERNGRLFHAHPTSPYPLPVDTPEQERLKVLHGCLYQFIGAYYVGPVPHVLSPDSGRQKLVVDLGTGSGKWVLDMAFQFPHVFFYGLDIVPIATRYPPNNVQFEIHDINERTRFGDGSVDVVHARSISMTTQNYPAIISEVSRILRPGGLFISCEWGRYASFHPNFGVADPSVSAPALCTFYDLLGDALEQLCGLRRTAGLIPSWIHNSGAFTNITGQDYYLPLGPWGPNPDLQRLGRALRGALIRFIDSVRPLLLATGINATDLEQLITDLRTEIASLHGLVLVAHTVHATKL